MKKAVLYGFWAILLIFMIPFFTSSVHAEKAELHPAIAKVLNKQLSEEERAGLLEDEHDLYSMDGVAYFGDSPMMRIFSSGMWMRSGKPFDEMITETQEYENETLNGAFYIIFDKNVFKLKRWTVDGEVKIAKVDDYAEDYPNYLKAILDLEDTVEINGEKYAVENVYCYDTFDSRWGAVIYIKTAAGVLVEYFEDANTEGAFFPEAEFREKAAAYYRYISSYEYNYDKDGNPLNRGTSSFLDFLKGNVSAGNGSTEKGFDDPSQPVRIRWFVPGVILFTVLPAGGAVAVILIRSKKKAR